MKRKKIANSMFKTVLNVQIMSVLVMLFSVAIDGAVTGSLLKPECMTAYGLMLPLITIVSAIIAAINVGTSTVVGKDIGSGDFKKANADLSSYLELSLIFAAVITLVLIVFSGFIANALGATGALHNEAVAYLVTISLGFPAMFCASCFMQILQMVGKKQYIIYSILTSTGVNIALDLLNGLVLHKGLLFMGLATTIGNYAGLLIILLAFLKKQNVLKCKFNKISSYHIKELFRFGIPGATAMIFRNVLSIMINSILLSSYGNEAVASFTAIMSVLNMCMSVGTGLGGSTSLLTALFYGEKDATNIQQVLKIGIFYSIIINAVITIIICIFATPISSMFTSSSPGILPMTAHGLQLMSLCLIFYSINAVLRFYYQASGVIVVSYLYAFINCIICVGIPAVIFSDIFGINGIWISYPIGEALTIFVMAIFVILISKSYGNISHRFYRIPQNFYNEKLNFNEEITSPNEVTTVSEKARIFMLKQNSDNKTAYYVSLALEEFCNFVVEKGFSDNKNHRIEVSLSYNLDAKNWVLRIRDNCPLFNAVELAKNSSMANDDQLFGIRMILKLINEVNYVSSFNINCVSIQI